MSGQRVMPKGDHWGVRQVHTRSEVWCPGYDLAKAFLAATRAGAEMLVREHAVRVVSPLRDEIDVLPPDLVQTFNEHVAALAQTSLARYGVEALACQARLLILPQREHCNAQWVRLRALPSLKKRVGGADAAGR